ncbi:peptide ABC transporter ATP-binding protein [Testudinibacter sp. TR-2022]|uniref:peptide ABC transporter ATP-binding protein n=1 Tax=Testudinibacter sp. TR-2022 TaxID=2585029 RepID=UPI00111B2854|nr:ATP-binding cassette domain-containing protein [Testudinibacter sp. TR-2022]TNH06377.1 ATP-binding cassette domain-containing protein [Pasteurellaceae bacterium Phil11]TNH20784.1 ATP-binding cassette domain-containing protein [Testudinibacter sp. TR-2022]TNH25107.1 ATP-binding cassette domain-containing protein [Testudinibacter sp. TR-2022]
MEKPQINSDRYLLQVEDLSKSFRDHNAFWHSGSFAAVCDISFSLEKGTTLAIVGANGSGKSTLAKMISGVTKPTKGRILFKGRELEFGDYQSRCRHIRMVFQDPDNSLIPHLNIGQVLDTPLRLSTPWDEEQRNQKIYQTLRLVGISPDHANIPIYTLSQSQKQRVALARAVILEPEILVLDNALSSMDASVKTQLINLLLNLQKQLGISYIYLGQHVGIIKHISDNILVMKAGHMVEYGNTREVLTNPADDFTRRLIESHFGHALDASAWEPDSAIFE